MGRDLFWVLAGVVVPAALFRVGMAVVDRVRPRGAAGAGGGGGRASARRGTALRRPELTLRMPRLGARKGQGQPEPVTASSTLPWFTPEADPGAVTGAGADVGIGEGIDTGAGTATTNTTKTKGNT